MMKNQILRNMKKLLILFAAAAISLVAGCSKEYDDTNVWNSINSLEQRLSAMETVMNAYKNNLFIKSVQKTGNGYVITFSDGSTATIANGIDGAKGDKGDQGDKGDKGEPGTNGDTLIDHIVIGENEVTFVLTDGRTFSIALYSALSIEFDEADLVVMSPNSTREIHYTVKSLIPDVVVETISSADIKAKVVTTSATTGVIKVKTGATIDEYSKVVVFVSNGEKVIMRRFSFEEAGLVVEENTIKQASSEGGEVTLEFLSNVECEVVIPEDSQSWISVAPEARALERQTINLKLEPNTSHNRSATVIVQLPDGSLQLEYQVEQEGDLGAEINPEDVPDDEIWYITTNNDLIRDYDEFERVYGYQPFDKTIISHIYTNGKGVIKFDGPVKEINEYAMRGDGNFSQLRKVYLPNCVTSLANNSFFLQEKIEEFKIPDNLKDVGYCAFGHAKIRKFIGKNVYNDGEGILIDGVLCALTYDEHQEHLVISNDVVEIGECLMSGSFYNDFCVRPNLKSIEISEGVKIIDNSAFAGCSALETVSLPSSLEDVGTYIFWFCPQIKEFSGNSQFVTADHKCFLNIYEGVVSGFRLQSAAKAGLPDDYIIPEGIVDIDPNAFEGCKNLRSVTLPQSLYILESGNAFKDCPNFEFIYGDYTSEDNKAAILHNRLYCDGPSMVAFAGKGIKEYETPHDVVWVGGNIFSYQNDLEKVVINDDVYFIGNNCFSYSPNLKSITLPKNLETIRYDPFKGSDNLESVYLRALYPPQFEIGGIEQTEYAKLSIYVPEQSLQTYLDDAGWAPLRKYIKGYKYDDYDFYVSSDYSQNGKVVTLQTATKGDGIDVVLMGDAYSDRQIADGTYKADMEYIYNNLFTEEPYKSFKDHFNVHYVNVVSATEGYEYNNTALDGYFGDGTLVGGDDNAVFNYALKAISEAEMNEALLIVAMNSDNYAGTCYMYNPANPSGTYGSGPSVAYFPRGGNETTFVQLLHHEAFGHGFAKLADEYAYEDMGTIPEVEVSDHKTMQNNWGWWKNVDFTSNPAEIRWSRFISDPRYANEGLGAFEGGLTYWSGVWRPTENSIMRYNTGGFNAPSREAIYYRIHKLAYGDSWQYDYEKFVEWDARNRAAAATRARARKPANYKPTHPPVVVKKPWRDAK